ncbi:MAG: hypothetical protein HY840_05655 [Bacteroidetes bacterium]|nr:hypothetical protein [Bacteroidota bacterium]
MKLFIQVFFLLFIFGCSGNQSEENKTTTSSSNSASSFMPKKSQFKYWNAKFFGYKNDSQINQIQNHFPDTLTMRQRKRWDYNDEGITLSEMYYGGKLLSFQNHIGDISPIVIEGSSDDYGAYTLICLNKNAEMISWINLAGGPQGGHDSSSCDSCIPRIYSHEKHSVFLNDSCIKTYFIKSVYVVDTISKKNETFTFDSIVSTHQILRNGKIVLLRKDSIRIRNPF